MLNILAFHQYITHLHNMLESLNGLCGAQV